MHLISRIIVAGFLILSHTHLIYPAMPADQANNSKRNIILCFNIGGVVSDSYPVGIKDYLGMVPRVVIKNPKIVSAVLPGNFAKIRKQADEISKAISGSSNVVHAVIQTLKEQGYCDLSPFEDEIIERALKPWPIVSMIKNIKKLKELGYTIIGSTYQDSKQHLVYQQKMKALYNIDMSTLFDAILTTRVNHEEPPVHSSTAFYKVETSKNIYVVKDGATRKPSTQYFAVLKELVHELVPEATIIIYSDAKQENIDGAQASGLTTVHLKWENKSPKKDKPQEIKRIIKAWKADLSHLGIMVY